MVAESVPVKSVIPQFSHSFFYRMFLVLVIVLTKFSNLVLLFIFTKIIFRCSYSHSNFTVKLLLIESFHEVSSQ